MALGVPGALSSVYRVSVTRCSVFKEGVRPGFSSYDLSFRPQSACFGIWAEGSMGLIYGLGLVALMSCLGPGLEIQCFGVRRNSEKVMFYSDAEP